MNKDDFRQSMLIKRRHIQNKSKKSTEIVEKIKKLDVYRQASIVAVYQALVSEVNLAELIIDAQNSGKKVLLPKILNDKLAFILLDANTHFQKSTLGILEPINDNTWQGKIDLILIPGISFDKENNRLGFGKGYYDKFLSKIDAYKIGVCFAEQIVELLPTNKYDQKMDLIVHEKSLDFN